MHAPGDVRVENRDEPRIVEPTDAVIRVTAACVCGSDLWQSHLELDWESERFRRFWEGVADGYSLIRYDRLGVGMSDRTGRWIVPIPGTTKPHRLEENIAAGDLELTADDLREIDDALSEAQGARYSEVNQRMIDRGDGSISSVLRSEIASSEGSLATNCGGVISTRGG